MRLKFLLIWSFFIEQVRGLCNITILKFAGLCLKSKGQLRMGRFSRLKMYTKNSVLKIGKSCYVRDFCSIVVSDGHLTIGDNFFMNNHSSLNCMGTIEIGDNCLFGEAVKLYDHNYDYRKGNGLPYNQKGHRRGKIKIGNNCWLGSNCVVLMNVTIGDNVIIGANTVIYKDVPSNTLLVNKQGWQMRENEMA